MSKSEIGRTCRECGGACCRWVSVRIQRKTTDSDQRAWMDVRGVRKFGMWWIPTRCRHLSWRGRCKVYAKRPRACREYGVDSPKCRAVREVGRT